MFEREKFAFARGAQIQVWYHQLDNWYVVNSPNWYPGEEYRIHPSDSHLEYGPVSSKLKELAVFDNNTVDTTLEKVLADRTWTYDLFSNNYNPNMTAEELHFYFLFLVEYLADLGL